MAADLKVRFQAKGRRHLAAVIYFVKRLDWIGLDG